MVQSSHTLDWYSVDCQLIWQSPHTHKKPDNIYIRLWGLIQTVNTTEEHYLEQLQNCRNKAKKAIISNHLQAKQSHYPYADFPLIAFHPTQSSYHDVCLKKGEMIPVTLVFGGEHRHLAKAWLQWFQVRLSLENTGFELLTLSEMTHHQINLPTLTANRLQQCQQANQDSWLKYSDELNISDIPEMVLKIEMPANFSLTKSGQTHCQQFSQIEKLKYALWHNCQKRFKQWFAEQASYLEQWFNSWESVLMAAPICFYQLHERHALQTVSKSSHASPQKSSHPIQYHTGHAGWLTLKGAWLCIPEFWQILSDIHFLGQRTQINGLGYFLTESHFAHLPPTLWQRYILDKHKIRHAVDDVLNRHELDPVIGEDGRIMEAAALTELIYHQLASNHYQPQPTNALYIAKPSGGQRCIEQINQLDMMVHKLVFNAIVQMIDAYQSPLSLGYRQGYSRQMAKDKVQQLIDAGFTWVVEADIEAFFDNVPFDHLWKRLTTLLPKREHQIIDLIKTLMQVTYVTSNSSGRKLTEHERTKGLMQGSPLSPILANLYLALLDEHINAEDLAFVRYADDVLIFCHTQADASQTLLWLQQQLQTLGLNLSFSKSAITSVTSGFEFLGYRFDKEGNDDKSVVPILRQRKPIMIIGQQKYLSLNGSALEIREKRPRKKAGMSIKTSPLSNQLVQVIPLRRISQLVIMGNHSLSSPLLSACAKYNISVHVVNQWGFQIGTFRPTHAEYYAICAKQYHRHQSLKLSERLAIASDLVLAKINNYQTWMINSYRKGDAMVSRQLTDICNKIGQATTIEALMGYEGQAAKLCFKRLQTIIIKEQQAAFMSHRRSRGGVDRLNSMLNFGYYWLFTRISSLLHSHGLNPYLSFLHEPEQSYETLVYDLMELFRVQVDKTAIRLINRKQIQADSFHLHPQKGWQLNSDALHLYSNQLQATFASKINQTYLEDIILMQIRILLQWATENKSLIWFYWYADKNNVGFALPDAEPQTIVIDSLDEP